MIRFFLIALGSLFCIHAYSQDSTLAINLSAIIAGSSGTTPFWMHANQNGSVPIDQYYASGKWGIYKVYNPNNPRLFQVSGGAELITNYSTKGNVFFTDLYAAAKIGPVEFLAGQKKSITGLVDSTFGSGSLALSGNARPFPKAQISVPDFQPLAFTGDFVALKGSISEGLLGPSNINYGAVRRIDQTRFHQKQLYFRLGRKSSWIKGYFGMNHQVIWGGEDQLYPIEELNTEKSYLYVLTGQQLHRKTIGTHFGTTDLALDFRIKKWQFFAYRNNIYETGSIFKIINLSDGLNGLRIIRNKISGPRWFRFRAVNLEYLSLLNQKNQFEPSQQVLYQIANYYNSYIYQKGWSYGGFGLGSPLVPAAANTKDNLVRNVSQFTNDNRVRVFNATVSWQTLGINFLGRATYSRNYGTYLAPFENLVTQWSGMISAEKQIKLLGGCAITGGVASDFGSLYENSTAVFIGIKKTAFIN